MTNPNNAVGTNGAYDGRTSVNAFNDNLALYNGAGVLSGWEIIPDTGLVVSVGGQSGLRDVAIAEDPAGNRTTINNISGSEISVTIPGAPATGKRIDLIVAYVENPPQGSSSEVDNPTPCGLITVSSTASSNPSIPSDTAIRNAITADGAAGSTAYYVILGYVTITSGTTDIDSTMVTQGAKASVTSNNIDFTTFALGPIQKITVAGTTSGLGYITSAIPTNAVILGIIPSINAVVLASYTSDGTFYALRFVYGYNLDSVANTSVSADVYYAIPN